MKLTVKKIRQFDGSASSIKKMDKLQKHAHMEELVKIPIFGDQPGSKAVSVFNSGTDRFRMGTYV